MSHYSVSGKETYNTKQIEIVGMNFINALTPEAPDNKFKEYLFNKFSDNIQKESRYSLRSKLDSMPYDEKYNKARKLNPDEDMYYISPVLSYAQLYERKQYLTQAIKMKTENMQKIRTQMEAIKKVKHLQMLKKISQLQINFAKIREMLIKGKQLKLFLVHTKIDDKVVDRDLAHFNAQRTKQLLNSVSNMERQI